MARASYLQRGPSRRGASTSDGLSSLNRTTIRGRTLSFRAALSPKNWSFVGGSGSHACFHRRATTLGKACRFTSAFAWRRTAPSPCFAGGRTPPMALLNEPSMYTSAVLDYRPLPQLPTLKKFDAWSTLQLGTSVPSQRSLGRRPWASSFTTNDPQGLRLSIEHAMQSELIKLVVCTSTLAQGVNLPNSLPHCLGRQSGCRADQDPGLPESDWPRGPCRHPH